MDFECRSRPVNNYANICLGVPKSQINLYKFLLGLSREYRSSFTNEEIVKNWQECQPAVPRSGFQPCRWVWKLSISVISGCCRRQPSAGIAPRISVHTSTQELSVLQLQWRVHCCIVGHAQVSLLCSVKTVKFLNLLIFLLILSFANLLPHHPDELFPVPIRALCRFIGSLGGQVGEMLPPSLRSLSVDGRNGNRN